MREVSCDKLLTMIDMPLNTAVLPQRKANTAQDGLLVSRSRITLLKGRVEVECELISENVTSKVLTLFFLSQRKKGYIC